MKNKTSAGLHCTPSFLTKEMYFSYDLVFVRNCKYNRNIAFLFKEKSLVKPIFKMGSDQVVGSYHPVTLVLALLGLLGEKENS